MKRPASFALLSCLILTGCGGGPSSKPEDVVPVLTKASKAEDVDTLSNLFDEPYASCYRAGHELRQFYKDYDQVEKKFLKGFRGGTFRVANFTPVNYDWFDLGAFELDRVETVSPTKAILHGHTVRTRSVRNPDFDRKPLKPGEKRVLYQKEPVKQNCNFTAIWKDSQWKLIPWGRYSNFSGTRPFPLSVEDYEREIPAEQVEKTRQIIASVHNGMKPLLDDVQAGKFKSMEELIKAKNKLFGDACTAVGAELTSRPLGVRLGTTKTK